MTALRSAAEIAMGRAATQPPGPPPGTGRWAPCGCDNGKVTVDEGYPMTDDCPDCAGRGARWQPAAQPGTGAR